MEIRPIDANALVETLKDWRGDKGDLDVNDIHDVAYYQAMSRAIRISEGAPTLDYEPVRHGEWVGLEFDGYADGCPVYDLWECSECKGEHKGEYDTLTDYCPNCGAKMGKGYA